MTATTIVTTNNFVLFLNDVVKCDEKDDLYHCLIDKTSTKKKDKKEDMSINLCFGVCERLETKKNEKLGSIIVHWDIRGLGALCLAFVAKVRQLQ